MSSTPYNSEGFDVDALAGNSGDDVVLELGGGATVVPKEQEKTHSNEEDPAIAVSQQHKARGNEWFQKGNYLEAYDCYTDAAEACPGPFTGKVLLDLRDAHNEKERYRANEEFRKRDVDRRKEMQERAKKDKTEGSAAMGENEADEAGRGSTASTNSNSSDTNDAPPKPKPFEVPAHPYAKELSVYHCNRAACCMHLHRLEEAIKDCDVAILLQPTYIKALIRRCSVYEQLEKYDEALEDANMVKKVDPPKLNKSTIPRLERLRKEQLDKLKEETMGQLKDLGNSLLGNFGLSLDNFAAVQDPNTGSYSISFNQKGE